MGRLVILLLAFFMAAQSAAAGEISLSGEAVEGGIMMGEAPPGSEVRLDGKALRVDEQGRFLFGFHRKAPQTVRLQVAYPDGSTAEFPIAVADRDYEIQRIDGLPPKMVTPPEEVIARIQREAAMVRAARESDLPLPYAFGDFRWPVEGRISGIYGSQRVLNGEPRQPHYGIDIAAPEGTPVKAPAGGEVILAEDLYFSGHTLMIDHGHGLQSAFLHLAAIDVAVGERVRQGQIIGRVGASGRATGPHLDWRVNWFDRRVDASRLVGPMPE